VIVSGTDGLGKWSALKKSLPGRIFISYRRRDTEWPAARLYELMVENFDSEQVFKDVDSIDPGDDFVQRVTAAVRSCDVLLALIGPQWLTITNENGQRRLDNPKDLVRVEIETALKLKKIRVIPILVLPAQMPREDELPAPLAPLVRRNAVEISPQRFDTERLIETVQQAAKAAADARIRAAKVAADARKSEPSRAGRPPDEAHYRIVADRILAGAVVPFLGEGVNLCGRPDSVSWQVGHPYLPSMSELAAHLARESGYPFKDRTDLMRVSQWVDVLLGKGPLYELLHEVLDAEYEPTPVHRLLASLPSLIRAHPSTQRRFFPLIVTTNYDDALERAFKDAEEEYDLVTYIADGSEQRKFLHTSADGDERVINKPKSYAELQFDERPVIAKIRGTVERGKTDSQDSYVITENHYIDYLSDTNIGQLLPQRVKSRLMKSSILFLGYSLTDWSLRVILRRLWDGDPVAGWRSWAIQANANALEERSWFRFNVELLSARLKEYIDLLDAALISASTRTGELS
jgi:SIR2-like domain/TIR domain